MTDLVGHFIIFGIVAVALLAIPLIIGWFVRPNLPTPEKVAIYECGEPTIGSSYIQFDLRFYVVALLFIIFDVEVAFFFPWALIYGGATQLADPRLATRGPHGDHGEAAQRARVAGRDADHLRDGLSPGRSELRRHPGLFRVLLVGFAYVWKRGDLDWVRAVTRSQRSPPKPEPARPCAEPVRVPQTVS